MRKMGIGGVHREVCGIRQAVMDLIPPKPLFLMGRGNSAIAASIYDHILEIVESVFGGRVDVRRGTQMLRIYEIIMHEKHSITTRELFYRSPGLFISQRRLAYVMQGIASRLKVDARDLRIVAAQKGIFFGGVTITYKSGSKWRMHPVNGAQNAAEPVSRVEARGVSLIPSMLDVDLLETDAQTVLVVEKEAIFSTIVPLLGGIERALGHKIILVTGKGYPCRNTLEFLCTINIGRVLGLFDLDPHGLQIYKVYKRGSRARPNLRVSQMERIGVSYRDTRTLDPDDVLALSPRDLGILNSLIASDFFNEEEERESIEDLLFMREQGIKMEMESIIKGTGQWESYITKRVFEGKYGLRKYLQVCAGCSPQKCLAKAKDAGVDRGYFSLNK